jgi:CRP-like cAMP-binding protein
MGLSREVLVGMTFFMKEKRYRRRDTLYKENDIATGIYFIKEGEFEITTKHKTYMDTYSPKVSGRLLKTKDMKISIVGTNSCVGLEDMQRDTQTVRTQMVTCVSEKALVYFLSKDDYYKMVFKNLKKNAVDEEKSLKKPFFNSRI